MNNFYQNKTFVVTGGSGFVGSHYILELIKRGAKIRTHTHINPLQINNTNIEVLPNIDLTKLDDCFKLIEGADYVIHSGGQIAHPSTVPTDIQISMQNILVLGNTLEASYKSGVKRFLDLNSSTGYPDRRYPIKEEEFWEEEPYKSYYGYGWMRRYREKLMEHVYRFSNMEIALARGTAIYGPYDNFNLKTCHVVPALIKRILDEENPLVVWGTSDVVRDFLYVKDVIKAALLILEKGESMRPYNVGSGNAINVGDIVNAILKATNKKPEVIYDATKPTTIPFRMVNTERIKTELGFIPDYTFEAGIKETVDWYIKNYKPNE
jgi:GDP-L-fucose synthase